MSKNRSIGSTNLGRKTKRRLRGSGELRGHGSRRRSRFGEVLEDRRLLASDFGQIATALNTQLLGLQTQLTATLNNYQTGAHSSIPLVGNSLGTASQIVSRFSTELRSALTSLGTISNPSDLVIQQALATVPFLADRNSNGVGAEDVLITRPANLGGEGFAVQMRLQATPALSGATISFNSGLPALPLSVAASGTIDVSVGFAYELAFTYSSNNHQVALDSTKTLAGLGIAAPSPSFPVVDPAHPLALFISAGLHAGFSAHATLGFVQGTATPIAEQANALYLTAMVDNLSGTPTIKLDGGADANLRLTGSIAGTDEGFPAIDADFHLHWAFSSSNPTANPPQAKIDNVSLNLGQFISNLVSPVIDVIQTTTAPLEPVEDILRYALPGLSDLSHLVDGGDVTLLTLADLIAPFTEYGPLWDLIHSMGDLVYSIDQLELGDSLRMPLGGFDLNNHDLREIIPAGDIHNLSLSNLTELTVGNLQATNLPVPSEATAFLASITAALTNGYRIEFPILDDPEQAVFNMLLGRDSDLFTFTADYVVNSQGSVLPSFSVFGMGVEFGGDVHLDAHFKFAYDTYGLRQLVNHVDAGDTSQIASDVLAGFYISDDSHFTMSGGLFAGVGVTVGIFSAKVGGFVSTDEHGDQPVSVTINDPNNDGKLRFSEFQAGGLHTSGRFTGELGIEVKVGITVFGKFIGLKKRFDIASVVIVDLNMPGPLTPPVPVGPILASQPDVNGNIELHVGATAHLRQEADQVNGNDKYIIRNIETTDLGETIEIALLQELVINDEVVLKYWVTQIITGVRSITGFADQGDLAIDILPGVNVGVHFEGGEGKTELLYNGTGSAYLQAGEGDAYLLGGQGGNVLLGGPGNDTLVLGPGGNVTAGSLGDNFFVITTPMSEGGLVLGGSDEGHNTFVVLAGADTQSISAMPGANGSIDLTYQITDAPPSTGLALRQFSTLVISAQDRSTDITIGDLSPAGVSEVIVNNPTSGEGGRHISLDTRAGGGTSQITVAPFLHTYFDDTDPENVVLVQKNELEVINATTGVTTYLLGMTDADVTTLHQHGGSAQIGQLSKNEGAFTFDFSSRQPGAIQTVTMSTPALVSGNVITSQASGASDFVVDAINYPSLVFHGLRAVDGITVNVSAPTQTTGVNQVLLDASSLIGTLNVVAQGGSSANNIVTISDLGQHGSIGVNGGSTTTTALFGTGRLADIRGNVLITSAVLTIDNHLAAGTIFNSTAPGGSILTMTSGALSGWTIPLFVGPAPVLSFSALKGLLTTHAGAGDRFTLESAPASITGAVFNNTTASRDAIYIAAWSKPLTLNGDFSMYLGERLLGNGAVQRIEHLTGLANVAITLNYSSAIGSGNSIVFDGDLDPVGASYAIDGNGNLHVVNQTVGLSVTINNYRDQDEVHLRLSGGSVHANLTQTGRGTFYVDGTARSTGIHPTATNQITVDTRAGAHTLDPANSVDTVLHAFDTLYVLGAMTQDDLTLNLPTVTAVTNTLTADAGQLVGTLHINALDPLVGVPGPWSVSTIVLAAVNPLLAVFVVGNNPFPGSSAYQVEQTKFAFGSGQLARIRGNVSASKVALSIDDSAATQPSDLMLTDTRFNNWIIPGSSLRPALTYSNLYKSLTMYAGAGDRFDLNRTPLGVTNLVMHNVTTTLDPVFTANWSVPVAMHGNFSFYAGRRLVVDDLNQEQTAVIDRVRRLTDVAVAVTLTFNGTPASEVVLDGDLEPAGSQYAIDGSGNLHVVNQTVGLSVTINGYRNQDELYVYMPGASVAANLHYTSPGTIYLDGTARLAGTNPTAANNITIEARYGQTEMVPTGAYNSLLDMFNDVYLLGSKPQDSLVVNVPTNVRIAPSKANTFDVHGNPNAWAEIYAARTDALIAWKEGPGTANYTPFNFAGSYASDWPSSNSFLPNPFATPYGIDVPYQDAPLSVGYFSLSGGITTSTVLSGTGRYFIVDPHPVAVDNEVQLDASQLRGSFQFNVSGPNYDYVRNLVGASFHSFPTYYAYNGFHIWGSEYDAMRVAFGQSNIVLSQVNPELSMQVNSENKDFVYPAGTFPPNSGPEKQIVVSDYPVTALNVGAGVLANIQGNVSALGVKLTADDSATNAANNLILTATTLTGWAGLAGLTHPTLTMSSLENRPLTLIGSPLDRFGVENIPATAKSTTIHNLATSGAPAGVYVMGKGANQGLNVVGNFELYVGRRLNANGTVTNVGQVAGVLASPTNGLTARPIEYDFTGVGQGRFVYDASNHVAGETASPSQAVITSNASDPTRGRFLFDQSYNSVGYGANTDIDFYGPTIAAQGFNPGAARVSLVVDHRLPGTVHYFAGPTVPPHIVRVMAAYGPVFIEGRGPLTRVEIDPATVTINFFNNSFGQVFNSPGNDLRDTILADVTVTNSQLTIRPDLATTPAPEQLKQIVVSSTQATGIAGAAIHYANLRDIVTTAGTSPGLLLQMPRHAARLTIVDSPGSATTGIHMIGPALSDVHVLGTTGRLALGSLSEGNQDANDFRLPASGQSLNFAAQSLTIGDGSVQNIHGEMLLGRQGTFTTTSGTVIDNRNDPSPRDANFYISGAGTSGYPLIEGLAPAAIRLRQLAGGLSIYSSANSHFTARGLSTSLAQAVSLYAGAGSSVDLLEPTNGFGTFNVVPAMRVLGAETVRFVIPGSLALTASSLIRIEADPARPNDVTHLIADYSSLFGVTMTDIQPPTFIANVVLLLETTAGTGRVSLGNATFVTHVLYQAATTHLTLVGSNRDDSTKEIRVADSGPLGTVIQPGRQRVNVLGTTGPVEIRQPVTQTFSSVPFVVSLGNAGNMQAIHGEVTVIGDNAALPTIPLQLNSAADGVSRTVTAAYPSANHWALSGIAPATIHLLGNRVATSLLGGTGNNTLVGPNAQNLWEINASNGGKLNGKITYSGFTNLRGGTLGDEFLVQQGGLVGGNLDGGPDYDVIRFAPYVLPETSTINLPAGIVPFISGTVTNVEEVIAPFAIAPVANQSNIAGVTITSFRVLGSGGVAPLSFSAEGLPAGLTINPQTGFISGTISDSAAASSPYQVTVSATDGFQTATANFQWIVTPSFSLINPGTLLAPEGVPLDLLIHADNPTHRALLFYVAGSVPSYLSLTQLDDSTAALRGTVYFYGGTYFWPVTVFATDGISTVSTSFNVNTVPGFGASIPFDLTSYAGTDENRALVNNVYGHTITVSASGLPAGLAMNSSGLISGTIDANAASGSPYQVMGTVTDHTISYSLPFAFQWTVLPQYPVTVDSLNDRTNYVGSEVSFTLDAYNPFNHGFTIAVSGLPGGILFDANTFELSGTIAPSAASGSPYDVIVTVTDQNLGVATTANFHWAVRPPISRESLNAGTPAGVPFLAHLFGPESNANPHSLAAVTYADVPTPKTVVYFLANEQLWQHNGATSTPVVSIDPARPTIASPFGMMAVPGRGVVFTENGPDGYRLWFADRSGARMLSEASLYPTDRPPVTVGNKTYFTAYDTNHWTEQLFRIRFNGSGTPIFESIAPLDIWGVQNVTAYAGGVAFSGRPFGDFSSSVLYWLDPTTDVPVVLLSSQLGTSAISDLKVAQGAAGTENLFFLQNTPGGRELQVINSAELAQSEPHVTTLATFDSSQILGASTYPQQPLISSGNLISFSVLSPDATYSIYSTQFWVSDGTPAGTMAVGAAFAGYDSISDQTSFAGALYFLYRPSSEATQIWKLDPASRQLIHVLDSEPSLSGLEAVGEKLYFTRGEVGASRLWFVTTGNLTPALVSPKAGNAYSSPQLEGATFVDGTLYFTALAEAVVDTYGNPTSQLWALGPAVSAPVSTIVGRRVFYNQSKFDGNTSGVSTLDDNAIATDKVALLPGAGQATFNNITSYTRGINGIMVDISGPHGALTASDFIFKVGANNTPSLWASTLETPTITVRPGAGTGGSDRVEIIFSAANAAKNKWLEVIVKGNDARGGFNTNTGLVASDIFFFGNRIGDDGTGTNAQAITSFLDENAARSHGGAATITNIWDFDRTGLVSATDGLAARFNAGNLLKINIANPPAAPEATPAVELEGEVPPDSWIASALASRSLPDVEKPPVWISERLVSLTSHGGSMGALSTDLVHKLGPRAHTRLQAMDQLASNVAEELNCDDMLLDDLLANL